MINNNSKKEFVNVEKVSSKDTHSGVGIGSETNRRVTSEQGKGDLLGKRGVEVKLVEVKYPSGIDKKMAKENGVCIIVTPMTLHIWAEWLKEDKGNEGWVKRVELTLEDFNLYLENNKGIDISGLLNSFKGLKSLKLSHIDRKLDLGNKHIEDLHCYDVQKNGRVVLKSVGRAYLYCVDGEVEVSETIGELKCGEVYGKVRAKNVDENVVKECTGKDFKALDVKESNEVIVSNEISKPSSVIEKKEDKKEVGVSEKIVVEEKLVELDVNHVGRVEKKEGVYSIKIYSINLDKWIKAFKEPEHVGFDRIRSIVLNLDGYKGDGKEVSEFLKQFKCLSKVKLADIPVSIEFDSDLDMLECDNIGKGSVVAVRNVKELSLFSHKGELKVEGAIGKENKWNNAFGGKVTAKVVVVEEKKDEKMVLAVKKSKKKDEGKIFRIDVFNLEEILKTALDKESKGYKTVVKEAKNVVTLQLDLAGYVGGNPQLFEKLIALFPNLKNLYLENIKVSIEMGGRSIENLECSGIGEDVRILFKGVKHVKLKEFRGTLILVEKQKPSIECSYEDFKGKIIIGKRVVDRNRMPVLKKTVVKQDIPMDEKSLGVLILKAIEKLIRDGVKKISSDMIANELKKRWSFVKVLVRGGKNEIEGEFKEKFNRLVLEALKMRVVKKEPLMISEKKEELKIDNKEFLTAFKSSKIDFNDERKSRKEEVEEFVKTVNLKEIISSDNVKIKESKQEVESKGSVFNLFNWISIPKISMPNFSNDESVPVKIESKKKESESKKKESETKKKGGFWGIF